MTPMQSTTIRFLILTGVGNMLLQLIPMLQAHQFDPWNLGITAVTTTAGILIRMGQADVIAPALLDKLSLGLLNRKM
jgi:hypothetical protein